MALADGATCRPPPPGRACAHAGMGISYEERLERTAAPPYDAPGAVCSRPLPSLAAAAGVVLVVNWTLREEPVPTVLSARAEPPAVDPLAYDDSRAEELEQAAVLGLSQPLYAKSPGGVFAAARRTESFRAQIEAGGRRAAASTPTSSRRSSSSRAADARR